MNLIESLQSINPLVALTITKELLQAYQIAFRGCNEKERIELKQTFSGFLQSEI